MKRTGPVEIIRLPANPAWLLWSIGCGALVANAVAKRIAGYTRPREFPSDAVERAVRYDHHVVDAWLAHLHEYAGDAFRLEGRRVIELGPGPDLGVGLILLSGGAASYTALDVNRLVDRTPASFYDTLLAQPALARSGLKEELASCLAGRGERLRYVCDPRFDPSNAMREPADLVVSQAAFEHFEDLPRLFERLARATAPGALACVQIDLETHVGWLRARDPLNIYRFPAWLYGLCHYPGAPNRVRPHEYASLFAANGWEDVRIVPLRSLDEADVERIRPTLSRRFRTAEIGLLGVMILARRRS